MDPDACLDEIRDIVIRFQNGISDAEASELADQLVGLVDGLDGWMTKGGMPPKEWRPL